MKTFCRIMAVANFIGTIGCIAHLNWVGIGVTLGCGVMWWVASNSPEWKESTEL